MAKPIRLRPRFTDDGQVIPIPPRPDHLWKPGESGNPGGRAGVLTQTVRDRMDYINDDGKTNAEHVVEAQLKKAKRGDTEAAKFLADRGYGKPIQPSVVEQHTRVVRVVEVPPEETQAEWLARTSRLREEAAEALRDEDREKGPN